MKKNISIHHIVLILLNIIGMIYLLFVFLLYVNTLPKNKSYAETEQFLLVKDSNSSEIQNLKNLSEDLENSNLIKSSNVFFLKSFLVGEFYNYQEKEYELSPNMTMDEIITEFLI